MNQNVILEISSLWVLIIRFIFVAGSCNKENEAFVNINSEELIINYPHECMSASKKGLITCIWSSSLENVISLFHDAEMISLIDCLTTTENT